MDNQLSPRWTGAILALALLAGCSVSVPGVPGSGGWAGGGASAVSTDANAWDFRYGTGIAGHPASGSPSGFAFDFPVAGDVDYLTTNVSISATRVAHVKAQVAVVAGTPTFVATDGCIPAAFHIMLVVRNDDLRSEDGRWWARLNGPALQAPSDYTMDVAISDFSQWSNVQGHLASDRPEQFRAAMASLGAVGLTFGACAFGHGDSAIGGTARFTVREFSVR